MRKATKTIISFAVVLIAGLNLIVPAFAQDPFTAIAVGGLSGLSGAGLFSSMASMSGVNINYTSTEPMDAMWNVLNPDHVYFSGEKHEATGTGEDVYDYIQVDIGDWLDAQSDFIVNFIQTNNVTDNSSGTVNGTVSYKGYPFVNRVGQTNTYYGASIGNFGIGEFTFADYKITVEYRTSVNSTVKTYFQGQRVGGEQIVSNNYFGEPVILEYNTSTQNMDMAVSIPPSSAVGSLVQITPTQATNTNWTSDTVNASVFDGWESAKVKIPSQISQLQTGWTLSDFLNEVDRIWAGAGEDNIIIEDGGTDPPVPPVPVPTTPLGDVPFDDWIDLWGQGIYEQLENQSDALDFIGSNGTDAIEELESIDENLGELEETAESIDTNIGVGNGILGGIRSLAQSAVNYLESIAEHVGELVEEIVAGTETLIAGILNQIPQAFGVIFGPIKQASSIWHYVVEWITSIGAPFQFIWSMASGTSYYIILPVYASLAAAVVLAFFKRFGR